MKHKAFVMRARALLTLLDGMTDGYDMALWKKILFVVPYNVYRECTFTGNVGYEDYEWRTVRLRLAQTLEDLGRQALANAREDDDVIFAKHESGLWFMFVRRRKTTIGVWLQTRKYFRKIGVRAEVKIVRLIRPVDEERFRVIYG